MRNRIKYSQNFLKNSELVRNLVKRSSISKDDTVLEIGAGEGIITSELLKNAGKVVAFELDRNFFDILSKKFQGNQSLDLKNQDFLNFPLPGYPYKVFSNIPFNITSAIIKKLTLEENSPEGTFLIVQKEAAAKFTGKPLGNKNSQISVILYPWFEFRIMHEFKPSDFSPKPSVNSLLLEIKKRDIPLIDGRDRERFEDFVAYSFSQYAPNISAGLKKVLGNQTESLPKVKPSEVGFNDWLKIFDLFLKIPENQQNIVKGSFINQLKQQESVEKVHRTRVDKDWRKFRK